MLLCVCVNLVSMKDGLCKDGLLKDLQQDLRLPALQTSTVWEGGEVGKLGAEQ